MNNNENLRETQTIAKPCGDDIELFTYKITGPSYMRNNTLLQMKCIAKCLIDKAEAIAKSWGFTIEEIKEIKIVEEQKKGQ